jgi:cell division protein FtsI (penicillin-binding protein 3)
MKATSQRDDNPCRARHFKPSPCAPAPIEGPGKQSLDTSHTRLIIAGALFLLAFLVIGARLVEVSVLKVGDPRFARAHVLEKSVAGRADIVDRNGVLLARSLAAVSLYANPKEMQKQDPRRVAQRLAAILP